LPPQGKSMALYDDPKSGRAFLEQSIRTFVTVLRPTGTLLIPRPCRGMQCRKSARMSPLMTRGLVQRIIFKSDPASVVRSRCARSAERLLPDERRLSCFVIQIEIAGRMAQAILHMDEDFAILCENRSGQSARAMTSRKDRAFSSKRVILIDIDSTGRVRKFPRTCSHSEDFRFDDGRVDEVTAAVIVAPAQHVGFFGLFRSLDIASNAIERFLGRSRQT